MGFEPIFLLTVSLSLIFIVAEVLVPRFYFGARGAAFAVVSMLILFKVENILVLVSALFGAGILGTVLLSKYYYKKFYSVAVS